MRDTFSNYHPVINFTYFLIVILSSMFLLHPILLLISMTAALIYSLILNGRKGIRFILFFVFPMMLVAGAINPLFNHRGVTILGYLWDNPITLESIIYGMVVGVMFGTVLLWFSCYNIIMTSDKFVYIFGRTIPALSLVFSMVLRFVPRFKAQIKIIYKAREGLGKGFTDSNLKERAKNAIRIISIMITWSLENAIETADSMKSRGYGLPGRTAFSIYHFTSRDKCVLAFILLLTTPIGLGTILGWNKVQYFPFIDINENYKVFIYMIYFALCYMPIIINVMERTRWRYLESKI